jgi:hypothetical protein
VDVVLGSKNTELVLLSLNLKPGAVSAYIGIAQDSAVTVCGGIHGGQQLLSVDAAVCSMSSQKPQARKEGRCIVWDTAAH